MKFRRKIMLGIAALAGIAAGTGTAYAQRVCEHVGRWNLVNGHYVCSGDYLTGQCIWTDDCRVNVD